MWSFLLIEVIPECGKLSKPLLEHFPIENGDKVFPFGKFN